MVVIINVAKVAVMVVDSGLVVLAVVTRETTKITVVVLRVATLGALAGVDPTAGVLVAVVVPIRVAIRKTSFFLCCWANRGSSIA